MRLKKTLLICFVMATLINASTGSGISPATYLDATGCYVAKDRDTLFFDTVAVGDSATQSFDIQNIHPTLGVRSTDVKTGTARFKAGVSMFALNPGISVNVDVKFKPTVKNQTLVDSCTFSGGFPPKAVFLKGYSKNGKPYFVTKDSLSPGAENAVYGFTIQAADPDNDPLGFTKISGPAWITILNNGVCSGTPGYDDGNYILYWVTLRIKDGTDSVDATYPIHIANIDRPPVFACIDTLKAAEDSSFVITVAANDPENDAITLNYVYTPAWVTVSNDSVKGLCGLNGAHDSVVIEAVTSKGRTRKVVPLLIRNVNDAPVILTFAPQVDTLVMSQDSTINFIATISDTDNVLSSLKSGYLFNDSLVVMPFTVVDTGINKLIFFVKDSLADTVKHTWYLKVVKKVLKAGDTLVTTIPLSGAIHLTDSSGREILLKFTGGSFEGKIL